VAEVTYRRLEENRADLEAVCEFLIATFAQEHQMGPLSAANFSVTKGLPAVASSLQFAAWVAERDGEIVGSIGLQSTSPWYTEVEYVGDLWLYVIPELRKDGVASTLVGFAKDEADARGMPLMVGLFNDAEVEGKISFFEKMGFRMVGAQFLKL